MLKFFSKSGVGRRSLIHSRAFSAATDAPASQFNIHAKMSDGVGIDSQTGASKDKKRPPSKRVLELADQILNLSLVEAADLCDVCQERLSERSGGIPLRAPFPHPGSMFGMGGMPMAPSGFAPNVQPASGAPSQASTEAKTESAPATPTPEEEKSIVSVKLVSYAADKRVGVIKEIRAILGLGLKESKELVESVPKVIKRGLPREEAEELKKKLEASGGVVEFS